MPTRVAPRALAHDRLADAVGLLAQRRGLGRGRPDGLVLDRGEPVGDERGVDAGVVALRVTSLFEAASVAEQRALEVDAAGADLPPALVDRARDAERLGV